LVAGQAESLPAELFLQYAVLVCEVVDGLCMRSFDEPGDRAEEVLQGHVGGHLADSSVAEWPT
jgi:hypothetical protein